MHKDEVFFIISFYLCLQFLKCSPLFMIQPSCTVLAPSTISSSSTSSTSPSTSLSNTNSSSSVGVNVESWVGFLMKIERKKNRNKLFVSQKWRYIGKYNLFLLNSVNFRKFQGNEIIKNLTWADIDDISISVSSSSSDRLTTESGLSSFVRSSWIFQDTRPYKNNDFLDNVTLREIIIKENTFI